jgi:hypothetical protein
VENNKTVRPATLYLVMVFMSVNYLVPELVIDSRVFLIIDYCQISREMLYFAENPDKIDRISWSGEL